VPVDWDASNREHFDLGLVKLSVTPSNVTSQEIGTLVVNPEGPGGPASQFVAALALGAIQSEFFLGNFDILGLDPRVVGLTNQVQCDWKFYAERVSLFPKSKEEPAKLWHDNRRLGEPCIDPSGPIFEHLDIR
jgi:hypothetical protein